MHDYKKRGTPVNITFSSPDASTLAAVVLTDCNGATVTLGANEQLLVDSLSCFSALTGTNRLEIIFDDDAGNDVDANELVASFGIGNGGAGFPGDGYPGKKGLTLKVKATAAGQIDITGQARIVIAHSGDQRPGWRETQLGH